MQTELFKIKPQKKRRNYDQQWMRKALDGQGGVVLSVMNEYPKTKTFGTGDMLKIVNRKGFGWEEQHIIAGFRNLKQRGLVVHKGGFTFQVK